MPTYMRIILFIIGVVTLLIAFKDYLIFLKSKPRKLITSAKQPVFSDFAVTVFNEYTPVKQENITEHVSLQHSINDIYVIKVKARDPQGFVGNILYTKIISAGLIFGDNDIFHRYDNPSGTGEILFSLEQMTEPRSFDPSKLPFDKVLGINLFFIADKVSNPKKSLEELVKTAKQLAFVLDGQLIDKHGKPLTTTIVDSYFSEITNKYSIA